MIYISHVIDHLDIETTYATFVEFYRVLKPNGIVRIVIPYSDRDILYSKIINEQQTLGDKAKIESTSGSIKHSLSSSHYLDDYKLYEIACSSNFDFSSIEKSVNSILKSLDIPENSLPDTRKTYLNEEKIKSLSIKAGFRFFYPLLRGNSFAKPFSNLCVFDSTEPQYSMYFELIK